MNTFFKLQLSVIFKSLKTFLNGEYHSKRVILTSPHTFERACLFRPCNKNDTEIEKRDHPKVDIKTQ